MLDRSAVSTKEQEKATANHANVLENTIWIISGSATSKSIWVCWKKRKQEQLQKQP
jgi:hypothetical protein